MVLPVKVGVLGGNRIPFARANGRYATASNQDMLTAALDGLVARFGLAGERLGEVVGGAVLKHSRDFNLTRESVLGTRLDPRTPAYDMQRACATSLEAAVAVANKIALGQLDAGIACGVDTASDVPIGVNEDLRTVLLAANRARGIWPRVRALSGLRPGQVVPEIPRNAEPRTGLSMGEHAARTAEQWDIGRTEQDELAAASHRNLAAAYDAGLLDHDVTPYLGLTRDEILRPDSTVEGLARLRTVFGSSTMTAGNSTPLSDGAASVLLASDEWAKQHRIPVLAHLVDVQSAAVDFVHGTDGLLTAPVYAVPVLLARNGLTLADIDLFEVHEAFAAQVLATLAAWRDPEFCAEHLGLSEPLGEVDRDRLNVAGSSLATGHPFAATGARILATTARLLHERGARRGLVSICAAGGQGVVALVERIPPARRRRPAKKTAAS
ncbi:acetyl-CoA C-acetyltransferase [Actinocatenispora rupis]|uniref:Acetyl-CoA acetyltransferase n=1 Tax=Actinocatenispora rupis TaxID=519421 RepID=A0A8J3NGV7_9ACTN|nr:acetyl-CoA C-acetyltransferase [Actinocatenispora rupis]GID16370.1 acetyl-CoA acetyltransferase [Actinocatenispora rupis]